ncbi:hypothetical protein AAG570_002581 [Ranatra chinensis]|uniref:SAMD1-like winged helix (WH) domain-containing protein n=1 Tax=Ranatra chinensis TaxID=642074 RepID=A0ABD0YUN3_9HEMI
MVQAPKHVLREQEAGDNGNSHPSVIVCPADPSTFHRRFARRGRVLVRYNERLCIAVGHVRFGNFTRDSYGTSVWTKWVVDAIQKIRQQKQRPSLERICHAIRQHHAIAEKTIGERLESLVEEGRILKLAVNESSDLTRIAVKAVRELGAKEGSTLKCVEKYVRQSNSLVIDPGVDLTVLLKTALALAEERALLCRSGNLYRYVEPPLSEKRLHREEARGRKRKRSPSIEESPKICVDSHEGPNDRAGVDYILALRDLFLCCPPSPLSALGDLALSEPAKRIIITLKIELPLFY